MIHHTPKGKTLSLRHNKLTSKARPIQGSKPKGINQNAAKANKWYNPSEEEGSKRRYNQAAANRPNGIHKNKKVSRQVLHKRPAKAAGSKRVCLRNLHNLRKNMSLRGLKKDRFYQQDSATNWDLVSTRIGSPASSISSFGQNNGSSYSPPYNHTHH
jgi:hypothetical protein